MMNLHYSSAQKNLIITLHSKDKVD